MRLIDTARIAWAVVRLEWWLEWYGAPSGLYRPMRRELASNLRDTAAEPGGVAAGVRRLGSVRETAREASADDARFRWERGAVVALLAFGVALTVQLVLSMVFLEGLLAAGGGEGRLLGAEVAAVDNGDESSMSITSTLFPPVPLAIAALVFLLVSRPWRYRGLRRRVHA